MRDWYEDHCAALTQELYNRNNTLRKLSKEYRDLQQAHAELQQAYTNEMLWNGELSEELKKVNDETI
jgi:prefoldin subunit 5